MLDLLVEQEDKKINYDKLKTEAESRSVSVKPALGQSTHEEVICWLPELTNETAL